MSKDKNIAHLNHQGISQQNICKTLKVSDWHVRNTLKKLKELNLTYDDIKDMAVVSFDELSTKKPEEVILKRRPDCKHIHEELKRKGVRPYIMSASKIKTQRFEIENLYIQSQEGRTLKQMLKDILNMGE